jgi:hypothetical protein
VIARRVRGADLLMHRLGNRFPCLCKSDEQRTQERIASSELSPTSLVRECFLRDQDRSMLLVGRRYSPFASGLQLTDHSASLNCVPYHASNKAKISLAEWQPIVLLSAGTRLQAKLRPLDPAQLKREQGRNRCRTNPDLAQLRGAPSGPHLCSALHNNRTVASGSSSLGPADPVRRPCGHSAKPPHAGRES